MSAPADEVPMRSPRGRFIVFSSSRRTRFAAPWIAGSARVFRDGHGYRLKSCSCGLHFSATVAGFSRLTQATMKSILLILFAGIGFALGQTAPSAAQSSIAPMRAVIPYFGWRAGG